MRPKVYPKEKHAIPFEKIDRHAYYVIEKLKQAGFIAYLVGGSVRDLLLHHNPKDFDIATSAKPEEIKRLFKNCILIGKRFRLAHIRFGYKILEVATFRSGDIKETKLITNYNIWGSPEEDAIRRDFTINGLFYNPETETIIDYVNGVHDAKRKILRCIGKSSLRFKQDPVRMIRLLKFKARFNFDIEPKTMKALVDCKDEITKSSSSRILEELCRMLESGYSKNFFKLLFEFGLLHQLLPKLAKYIEENPTNSIFDYLEQTDSFALKFHPKIVERPLLLSSLAFPMFQEQVNESMHLGIIEKKAYEVVHDLFSPFLLISRQMKAGIVSILTNQFRMVPLINKQKRIRIPKDPFFHLALKFLKIRSLLHKELINTYIEWHEATYKRKSA